MKLYNPEKIPLWKIPRGYRLLTVKEKQLLLARPSIKKMPYIYFLVIRGETYYTTQEYYVDLNSQLNGHCELSYVTQLTRKKFLEIEEATR